MYAHTQTCTSTRVYSHVCSYKPWSFILSLSLHSLIHSFSHSFINSFTRSYIHTRTYITLPSYSYPSPPHTHIHKDALARKLKRAHLLNNVSLTLVSDRDVRPRRRHLSISINGSVCLHIAWVTAIIIIKLNLRNSLFLFQTPLYLLRFVIKEYEALPSTQLFPVAAIIILVILSDHLFALFTKALPVHIKRQLRKLSAHSPYVGVKSRRERQPKSRMDEFVRKYWRIPWRQNGLYDFFFSWEE